MIELLLVSCAFAGLSIALYFSLVYYRVIEADNRWIPSFCRMEKGGCMRILDTPEAKVLGVPNSVLGVLYYLAILLVPISRTLSPSGRAATQVPAAYRSESTARLRRPSRG